MKKLLACIVFVITLSVSAFSQSSGHIPPEHQHRTGGYGICYGYAMGVAGKAPESCDPATMVKNGVDAEDGSLHLTWGVNTTYWTYHSGADLSGIQTGDIVAFGTATHVAYVANAAELGFPLYGYTIQVDDILSWGADPTTGISLERVGTHPNLTYKRNASLTATGYYRLNDLNGTAQNLFYDGANMVTDKGDITIAGLSGTSPKTASKPWNNYTYTAVATDNQDYPTGYKQIFNTAVGWTQGGSGKGFTLQIPIEIKASQGAYQANFYRAAGVTFTPVGGGKITVDGVTRTTSYTDYVRLNPSPAEQASGTAVNWTDNYIDYFFKYWTNSADTDTSYSTTASFYPTAAVTYSAHFGAKPLPPSNVSAGGSVGNPVHLTWTDNPNSNVTQYEIWRRVKPLGGSQGDPEYVATVNSEVEEYDDTEYVVTSSYTNSLLTYDVRSYLWANSSYSDPNWTATQFGEVPPVADKQTPGMRKLAIVPVNYAVSTYPNPFNPSTTISYQLVEEANVLLHIFDMMGREVASLLNDRKNAGFHSIAWHGKGSRGVNVASGTYFYRFTASPLSGKEPYVASGKLLLTK